MKKYGRDTVPDAVLGACTRHRLGVYETSARDAIYARTKSRARDYGLGCVRGRAADAARPMRPVEQRDTGKITQK